MSDKETEQKEEQVAPPEKENNEKYHEVHDGELHKLFNKKSSYLKDLLDFE